MQASKEYANDLHSSSFSFALLLQFLLVCFFRKTLTHYEAGAGSVDCCDCLPSGFKSSHYSLRATVLLQMLIVFSFCLSSGCLSFPLCLAVYTINLVHSLSHTHSRGLARRERLEGGIWTYLTEGHPSLSSLASPPPKATPCSFFVSSWFVSPLMQLSPHLLCFIVALPIITSLCCLWCSAVLKLGENRRR